MLYDGYDCVADYNSGDTLQRYYVTPMLDENLLVYDEADTDEEYFYIHDGLGTVRQILDASQTMMNQYDYEGFGTSLGSTESIYNRFRYTGRAIDTETESANSTALYYYRARTYDSTIGSFTSRDPFESSNEYNYCINNPIRVKDPFGRYIVCDSQDSLDKLIDYLKSHKADEYLYIYFVKDDKGRFIVYLNYKNDKVKKEHEDDEIKDVNLKKLLKAGLQGKKYEVELKKREEDGKTKFYVSKVNEASENVTLGSGIQFLSTRLCPASLFCTFFQPHAIFEISSIESSSMKLRLHLRGFSIKNSESHINLKKSS